jgi:prepilin-type N-terminal cleavage/methylation domain-containing protein
MSHRHPPAQTLRPKASQGIHPQVPTAFSPQASGLKPQASPHGLTLIEMLVALAVTLVMMAAVVNLFANISGSIRNRRAMIEVGGQLRQVRQRLALDLEGATAKAQPAHGSQQIWSEPGNNSGYIEVIEGDHSDAFPSLLVDGQPPIPANLELDYATSLVPAGGDVTTNLTLTTPSLTARPPQTGDVTNGRALGDWDDILALTVRSEAEPFKAQVGGVMVESTLAEVLWYADENAQDDPATPADEAVDGEPGMRRIYRRVLLIAPSLGPWNGSAAGPPNDARNVSVRFVPANAAAGTPDRWVANTLGDLTKRENRACREQDSTEPEFVFPHPFVLDKLSPDPSYLVLDNALAFDVRVYEPGAPLYDAGAGAVVQPGDPGWMSAVTAAAPVPVGFGAYCDLGWSWYLGASVYTPTPPEPAIQFGEPHHPGWHPRYINTAWGGPSTYDTWSFHYENDGINQDINQVDTIPITPSNWRDTLDEGANGLDDDNINGVDDVGERETSPPYNTPLRGVKVSLRIYETDARQIRETSVTHSFAE